MGSPKEARDHLPFAADQGLPHLTGAAKAGVSVQQAQVTLSGAAPHTIDLEAAGFLPMANAGYCVLAGGETAAAVTVDQSTMTAAGFDLLGGADTEVVHLVIVGCLKGQAVAV